MPIKNSLLAFLFALCAVFTRPFEVKSQTITSIRRASLSPQVNREGESYSYDPQMDGAGQFVIFTSTADNFAGPGKVEGMFHEHVYLRNLFTRVTTQLDVTSNGYSGSPSKSFNPNIRTFSSSFDPHISQDGKYVVFLSSESDISTEDHDEVGNWAYLKSLESGEIHRLPFATARFAAFCARTTPPTAGSSPSRTF